jgi:hypothetical protein
MKCRPLVGMETPSSRTEREGVPSGGMAADTPQPSVSLPDV